MRCYLKGELRRRFALAWFMVPEDARERLEPFLRSVRAVTSIRGTRLRLADGTRATVDEEGEAVLLSDETSTPSRGWLLVRRHAARVPEVPVIGMFLHELAHALYRLEDAPRTAIQPEDRAEAAAWLLAASWAAHGALGYRKGLDLVCFAMNQADEDLKGWVDFHPIGYSLGLQGAESTP